MVVPALIAEACEYCAHKEHDHPLAKCTCYGGFYPPLWVSDSNNIPWKCLAFHRKKVEVKQ